jgi:hypothetical protein
MNLEEISEEYEKMELNMIYVMTAFIKQYELFTQI